MNFKNNKINKGSGDRDVVSTLLESGANPNIQNKLEETSLFTAVLKEALDCIEVLLEFGADPLIFNSRYVTPYEHARRRKKQEILDIFNKFGNFGEDEKASSVQERKKEIDGIKEGLKTTSKDISQKSLDAIGSLFLFVFSLRDRK